MFSKTKPRALNRLEKRMRDIMTTRALRELPWWAQAHTAARMGLLSTGEVVTRAEGESGTVIGRWIAGGSLLAMLRERLAWSKAHAYTVELRTPIAADPDRLGAGPLVVLVWPDDEIAGPAEALHEVAEAVSAILARTVDVRSDAQRGIHTSEIGPTLSDPADDEAERALSVPAGATGERLTAALRAPSPSMEGASLGGIPLPTAPSWSGGELS